MSYFERIWESISYYENYYGKQPDVIFVSMPLCCELARDYHLECCINEPFHRLCGIPVKTYTSLYKEYYLAEGAYWLE